MIDHIDLSFSWNLILIMAVWLWSKCVFEMHFKHYAYKWTLKIPIEYIFFYGRFSYISIRWIQIECKHVKDE